MDFLQTFLIWGPPLVLAITFHEAAHGYVANIYGDDTAKKLGRLTLNPVAHVDTWGTIVIPLLLILSKSGFIFGYAKPVPVQVNRLRNPRWDMAKVALAGPLMNFALAILSAILLGTVFAIIGRVPTTVGRMLEISIIFNIILGLFNLLPVPPLDGGRVLAALLPPRYAMVLARMERFGIFIVLGVFIVLPLVFQAVGFNFDLFGLLILEPATIMSDLLLDLVS